jgi:hypothetical protein
MYELYMRHVLTSYVYLKAAFWYHVVHIILYAEPVLQDETYLLLIQEQAIKITDIVISDFPAALQVFSTHGLFFGKLGT